MPATEPRSLPAELVFSPALWRTVIGQALDDATVLERLGVPRPGTGGGGAAARRQRAAQARAWLLRGGEDFALVCDLAGWDPEAVRARARRVLAAPPRSSLLGSARNPGAALIAEGRRRAAAKAPGKAGPHG